MAGGVDLLDLPLEMVMEILSWLDNPEDLIRLRGSCKVCHDIVDGALTAWLRARPLGYTVELEMSSLVFFARRCESVYFPLSIFCVVGLTKLTLYSVSG